MTLNQTLCLLLLLGLTVPSGVAASLCVLRNADTRCVCSTQVFDSPQDLIICARTVELELRDGKLERLNLYASSSLIQSIQVYKLIFTNVSISFDFLVTLTSALHQLKVTEISIASSSILGAAQPLPNTSSPVVSKIKILQLENITVDSSLLQPSSQPFHLWLLRPLESLSLVLSGLANIECYWVRMVRNLAHLDLSENPLSWTSLQNISHCSSLSFDHLKSLSLRGSNLTSLQPLCTLLSLTPVLAKLDVSRNRFSVLDSPHCLQGVESLRILNVSHSGITTAEASLPKSLAVLDLSYNSLEVFHSPSQGLKQLHLSNNRLTSLPSLANLSQLQVLEVKGNQLTFLLKEAEAGVSQGELEQLDVIRAGRNPYRCDCTLKETIDFLASADTVSVQDWPGEFVCATPEAMRGTRIMQLPLGKCVKPTSGTRHPDFPLRLVLSVGLLSCLVYFC